MRVFLGTSDTASCLSGLALGLRARGVHVTTMVREPDPYSPDRDYDIVSPDPLAELLRGRQLSPLAARAAYKVGDLLAATRDLSATRRYLAHDVFVFILRPWIREALLFPVLRALGKKIVCYWLGTDVRHISALEQEFGVDTSGWPEGLHRDPLEAKLRKIRWSELYASLIYSVPDQAGLALRPYHHARIPFVSLDEITQHVPARRVPVVVHAPSRSEIKGTTALVAAVERLRARGVELRFELVRGLPRRELLAKLTDADIVVDELILEGPGVLSAEAMSAGCAVATHTSRATASLPDLPFVPVGEHDVEHALERLVVDLPYRTALARRGRAWVAETFGATVVADRLLRHLEQPAPEHVPDFFIDHYRVPKGRALSRSTLRLSSEVARLYRPDLDATRLAAARQRGVIA